MTAAGDLDQRVRIEQPAAEVPDGQGGHAKGWALVATVWAKVRPVGGRERLAGGQIEAPALYRVTIRRRTDLSPACRIVWQGQTLNVRSVPTVGAREPFLVLDCEAGVPV